jgi:uncharacterized membrane protein (UPF0136 family)
MNSRVGQFVLVAFLALLALTSAFLVYFSISLGHLGSALVQGLFGVKTRPPGLSWDDWYFVAMSAASILGAVGILRRKMWARIVCAFVFGTAFVWATAMSTLPQTQRDNWFSFTLDRFPAGGIALAMLAGLVWLGATQSRKVPERMQTI